ncbi:MAG: bi-domain-containing oxidoreductase [Chloroflexi bacterium]|nr:bi-domain-containing oxidoreductase [Chloroflexota bacterium]
MKQVVQSFKTGELSVTEVPTPVLRAAGILVRNVASLVSAGTERMVVDFAEKSLLEKARARPDLVRQVIDKAQREGIINTIDSVRNRLDQPLALGYSTAGVVVDVGSEAASFKVGDRVACAGGGYASHAEMVYVPRTLAVKLPDNVSFEAGAFATVSAIALQGIRQAEIVVGHKVAVIGLGLLGQLSVQMLKASGCEVMGIDLDPARVRLALECGAASACQNDAAVAHAATFTDGRGFDAVLITAATSSNEPVELAGEIARDRAIIVAVGAFGMNLPRKVYYEKELDFRLSRSYGPGRYDPKYEDKGQDYPYSYVRWTEQRNMEAFIQLVASGAINLNPLISHQFPIEDAPKAYDVITGKTGEPFLGVLLTYDSHKELPQRIAIKPSAVSHTPQTTLRIGMVGSGNFANATLLPAMKGIDGLELTGILSGSGMTARTTGDRFGFSFCTSDFDELAHDERVNWIVLSTRHNLHAQQAVTAMHAGKHVFVEKPLALNYAELVEVVRVQQHSQQQLMVGFNRRFAPMVVAMRKFLQGHQRPLVAIYRVNAGAIPQEHWTQDPTVGGGRIIGEVCHFIDLLQFLIGAAPVQISTQAVQGEHRAVEDEVIINLTFADGSIGTVIYAAGGDKAFGKERIEIIGDSRVAVLDDYRELELVHNGKRRRQKERLRPSKGHHQEWEALAQAAKAGTPAPIAVEEIVLSHLATFAALDSLRQNAPVMVDAQAFWQQVSDQQPE